MQTSTRLQPKVPRCGDLVFCHSKGIVGRAIRLGERLRFRSGDFYNHVAVLDRPTPDGKDWYVIQAEARGVTSDKLLSSVSPGGSHIIVRPPASVNAADQMEFVRAQVGQEYGFLTILSIAIGIILPRFIRMPSFREDETWICSAIQGEGLRAGGWVHNWSDIYQVVPSELFASLKGVSVRNLWFYTAAYARG